MPANWTGGPLTVADATVHCPECRHEGRPQAEMVRDAAAWGCPACGYHAQAFETLPPHFPRPDADPMAVLEARVVELEEINAAQYAEMVAWRTQLEAANVRLNELEGRFEPRETRNKQYAP